VLYPWLHRIPGVYTGTVRYKDGDNVGFSGSCCLAKAPCAVAGRQSLATSACATPHRGCNIRRLPASKRRVESGVQAARHYLLRTMTTLKRKCAQTERTQRLKQRAKLVNSSQFILHRRRT
jgi:hypothetical protein